MARSKRKRCNSCKKLLGGENFNQNLRSEDGLAANCRACVNRRRRELHQQPARKLKPASVRIAEAAKRGLLSSLKRRKNLDSLQLHQLLWKTVEDFHTIKKRPEHVALARWLIRSGARPHWSMICEAARGGHQPLINVLQESGVETNVFIASAIGDERALSDLLTSDPDQARANHQGITPLHYCGMSALSKADVRRSATFVTCAERLLQAGAGVGAQAVIRNLPGITPLHCVCWTGGNLELARLLIRNGADPKSCLSFALGHFQRHGDGHEDIAELLLTAGIDIHDEGDDILGRFAACGGAEAVRWLLKHGADPNVKSEKGRTALHLAAERNTGAKVIKLLVEHGADLNARTTDGHTPLYLAKLNSKRVAAEFLRQAGAVA